jgi:hypothetical protein
MAIFGNLTVQLDPWQVDYGSELPLTNVDEQVPDETVAIDVEVAPENWQPIRPREVIQPAQLIFVDGVRRIEARLIVRREERLCHGAFGSHAVGAVKVSDSTAVCASPRLGRVIVLGSGESVGASVRVKSDLVYQPLSTADTHPDAPLRALQEDMRRQEERLGRDLASTDGALVVADGPLTFEEPSRAGVLGYIKRIFRLYVPQEQLELLAQLHAGERTPLFALRSSRRFVRFSWFMRLAQPELGDSQLAGLARLEVSEAIGIEAAQKLANASTAMMPRFVPGRWRDPRSPQNLLPIGALEASLRRHMGDGRLIRRHIETLIATEARDV